MKLRCKLIPAAVRPPPKKEGVSIRGRNPIVTQSHKGNAPRAWATRSGCCLLRLPGWQREAGGRMGFASASNWCPPLSFCLWGARRRGRSRSMQGRNDRGQNRSARPDRVLQAKATRGPPLRLPNAGGPDCRGAPRTRRRRRAGAAPGQAATAVWSWNAPHGHDRPGGAVLSGPGAGGPPGAARSASGPPAPSRCRPWPHTAPTCPEAGLRLLLELPRHVVFDM
jgi:hypothetical protein